MANVTQFYVALRAKREALTAQYPKGYCRVMSLENLEHNTTTGNLCEVSVATAAELFVKGTHRLATAEECKAFDEAQEERRLEIVKANKEAAERRVAAVLGA
jgi:hypothetical protein